MLRASEKQEQDEEAMNAPVDKTKSLLSEEEQSSDDEVSSNCDSEKGFRYSKHDYDNVEKDGYCDAINYNSYVFRRIGGQNSFLS